MEIKLEPSSGKIFRKNMELTYKVILMVTWSFSWKELMYITMRLEVVDLFRGLYLRISNQEP